jgi:tetratricopeptide (TPR) repeat protein
MKWTDPNTKRLLGEMRRAYDLVEARQLQEAIEVYRTLLAAAAKARMASGCLHWMMAIACDYAGEMEMAFEHIEKAILEDPLAVPFRQSFDVVSGRVRAALADATRAADDPATPRLYSLLTRANEADVAAHLAMARYRLATGAPAEAAALVDAVTRIFPASREAWELKARVAQHSGDTAAADLARIEAAALAAEDPVFAVPGPASA